MIGPRGRRVAMRLLGAGAATVAVPAAAQGLSGDGVIAVPTIQSMLEVDVGRLGADRTHVALVEGYWRADDGGGGWLRWDAASTAGEDDFLVFRPRGSSGDAPGRWLRIADPAALTFEMAGARGDGVADDYPACQKALLFASRRFGACRVRLRPGCSYLLDHATWGPENFGIRLGSANAGALVVPNHCVVSGPGGALSGGESVPELARTARLVLHPRMTVFLAYFAELADLQVVRKDMGGPVDHFLPAGPADLDDMQAQVALWFSEDGRADANGGVRSVGITNGGINTRVRRVMVMGFHTGYYSDGFSGGDVDELYFDTAGRGIEVTRTADSARIRDCYANGFWSGVLHEQANRRGDHAARPGIAYDFHDQTDGLRCTDCSAIGWATGFRLANVWAVALNNPNAEPAGQPKDAVTRGILAEGVVTHTTIFNPLLDGFLYRIDFQHRPFARAVATGPDGRAGPGQYPTASITVIGGSLQGNPTDPPGHRMFRLGPYSAGTVIGVNLASYGGTDERPAVLAQEEVGAWKFIALDPSGGVREPLFEFARPADAGKVLRVGCAAIDGAAAMSWTISGTPRLPDLPASPAGLPRGSVWRDGDVVRVVV
ncbi:MAG TPA: hypothetical protein VIZ17_06250 [Acetobacteraceae bacterium]